MRLSDPSYRSLSPWTTSWASRWSRTASASGDWIARSNSFVRETQDDASIYLLLETEYSLVMVNRGEVLSAWWSSVTRIGVGERVLREEAAVVLVHSARPASGSPCEIYPGTILRLDLRLHWRRRPLQISPHVTCCRGFGRCGLSLVHRCRCLNMKYFFLYLF